jgi:branched-subunit amino acid transport protein
MKQIHKYIWLLIVLSAIASIMPFVRDIYLARTYGAMDIPFVVKANMEALTAAFFALQNLAAALWLKHVAANDKEGWLAWTAFGLFFGLIAIVIYYLVKLHDRRDA